MTLYNHIPLYNITMPGKCPVAQAARKFLIKIVRRMIFFGNVVEIGNFVYFKSNQTFKKVSVLQNSFVQKIANVTSQKHFIKNTLLSQKHFIQV